MKMSGGHIQKVKELLFKKSDISTSPEGAQKCWESFSSLVTSKCGLALFREFLQREYNQENLDFWLAIEEYKKCSPHELANKAKLIYDDFLAIQAPNKVNILDDEIRSTVLTRIQSNNLDGNVFNQAQLRIQNIMENDSYVRFCNSSLFNK